MEKFSSEYFKKLAKDIMFELTDQEVEELKVEFQALEQHVKVLDEIDTTNVEEMIYPYEMETTFIREDEVAYVISHEDAMKNVKSVKIAHVHVPKVVK